MPRLRMSGNLHQRSTPLLTSSTTSSSAATFSSVLQVSPRKSQLSIPQFDAPMPIVVPKSSSCNPAIVSSSSSISNSQIFSVLASPTPISSPNIQSMSLSRDVGSESPHLQPTSTIQTSSFSSLLTTSESFTTQSSQILHISPSVDFSRQVTHTKSLHMITTESIHPDIRNPTLYPPSLMPQNSFTPTIIAGIVAIALALATMAGCTLIGCIAIIHCKQRPHRVNGSTVERDDKDTISMKDDSSTPGEVV